MKTKQELEEMTKDELVDYADDLDVEVQHNWLKDEIIAEIAKGQRKAAKSAEVQPLPDEPAPEPVTHDEIVAALNACVAHLEENGHRDLPEAAGARKIIERLKAEDAEA